MRTARRVLIGATLVSTVITGCTAPSRAEPPTPSTITDAMPPATGPTAAGPTGVAPSASVAAPGRSTTGPPPSSGRAVVVLDPGHNGGNAAHPKEINRPVPDGRGGTKACNTTGTATNGGYPEHAFAFDVAGRVSRRLTAAGVRVVLTRRDDRGVGPCVDERGRAGEVADADAVVSIHADGSAPGNRGFHVAFADPPLNPAQRGPGRALAVALRDAMRGAAPDSDYIGRDGLSPRRDLAGLNLATRPAALVECANMRNAAEARTVSSSAGRDRFAAAISAGILAFLDSR